MINYILQIPNIEEINSNFIAKIIINLIIYFKLYFNYTFVIKNALYMAKIVASLPITYNKSKIT